MTIHATESAIPTDNRAEKLRFPVKRDGWDTVDFYLPLFIGGQIGGLIQIVMGISQLNSTPPGPAMVAYLWIVVIVFGAIQFLIGTITAIARTWQRYAEAYELTDSEFIYDMGFGRKRIPFAEISGVHPIRICRSTTALKPAVRLKFRRPVALDGRGKGGTIEIDVAGYKGSRPILQSWSIDVSPANLEGFLEDLAVRSPHLVREGPRFFPKTANDAGDGSKRVT